MWKTQKNIRNKQDELTPFQSTEKIKQNPDLNKINKQKITDKRYKTIKIHGREKLTIEQERPKKFFFDQEKQKHNHKRTP